MLLGAVLSEPVAVLEPETPKPGKTPRRANSDPRHTELIALWTERYREVNGIDYVFAGGKDAKAVQTLLKATPMPAREIVEIAEAAWRMKNRPQKFWCRMSLSLAQFVSRFNEIRLEMPQTIDYSKGF